MANDERMTDEQAEAITAIVDRGLNLLASHIAARMSNDPIGALASSVSAARADFKASVIAADALINPP